MISENIFTDCIGQLFSYYNKSEIQKSPLAMATWRKILNANLDDTQLITACQRCFAKYAFLPPIEKFVELITGDDEIPALEDWQTILNYVRQNGAMYQMSNAIQVQNGERKKQSLPDLLLSPQAEKALLMIGGIGKVIKPSEDPKYDDLNLKELKKQFIDLWSKYKRAIALGQVEPPPKMIKASEAPPIDLTQKQGNTPASPDAFETIKANLEKSHPDFFRKIKESPAPQPPTPVLLPNEVAANRAKHEAAFKTSQAQAEKLTYLAQK